LLINREQIMECVAIIEKSIRILDWR
jgi:hypothetical protein